MSNTWEQKKEKNTKKMKFTLTYAYVLRVFQGLMKDNILHLNFHTSFGSRTQKCMLYGPNVNFWASSAQNTILPIIKNIMENYFYF